MLIEQFAVFFLLLLTGFLCKKFGILTDAAVSAINRFIVVLAYPCLILVKTAVLDMDHGIFINFLLALSIQFGFFMLFGFYAWLYCRRKIFHSDDKPVAEFTIMSPNNGFMGFPVAATFFGGLGLLYMIGANIALNLMFFTYGISLMKRGRGMPGESLPKKILNTARMLVNPNIIAAFAGIILCYRHMELPGIARTYLDSVGSVATPLAMISIGTMLAAGFGLHSFRNRAVMEPVLNKLFIVPIIAVIVVRFLPIVPLLKAILIVSSALPTATTVPILSEQYDRNKMLAGEILVITTLFSMVTIPVAVWLMHQAGM